MPKETKWCSDALEGFAGFNKLLEHRVRLAICVLLSRDDVFSFSQLKAMLGETDGSLGAHLKRLEGAGYLKVRKSFQKRKPVSRYGITEMGRKALEAHLDGLSTILERARTRPAME